MLNPKYIFTQKHKNAFSLTVSLMMLVLLVLIATVFLTLVFGHSRLTIYYVNTIKAKQNAIIGMRTALSQLQLLTGADQRVTATADIISTQEALTLPTGAPVNGKYYWTGVWATGGLNKTNLRDWQALDAESNFKKPFLGWLVSDATNTNINFLELPVAPDTANTNSDALIKRNALILKATDPFSSDISAEEFVTLVGRNSVGDNDDTSKLSVIVRRVPLGVTEETASNGAKTSIGGNGYYAYWVGDEGVKAKVNIVDPFGTIGDTTEFLNTDDWKRSLRGNAQRNAIEKMEGLEDFYTWWKKDAEAVNLPNQTILPKISSINDLLAYSRTDGLNLTVVSAGIKKNFHNISFVSNGIFTDTYNGGLRSDLSVAFEMPWFGDEDKEWRKGFRDIFRYHNTTDKNENLNQAAHYGYTVARHPLERYWIQPHNLGFAWDFKTGETIDTRTNLNVEYLRGPCWDVLRNHYRFYKREYENKADGFLGLTASSDKSFITRASAPYSYTSGDGEFNDGEHDDETPINYNFTGMTTREYHKANGTRVDYFFTPAFNGKNRPDNFNKYDGDGCLPIIQSPRLSPIVLRVNDKFGFNCFSFNKEYDLGRGWALAYKELCLSLSPTVIIHNPYNVPIDVCGFGVTFKKYHPVHAGLSFWARMKNNPTGPYQQILQHPDCIKFIETGETVMTDLSSFNSFLFGETTADNNLRSFYFRYFDNLADDDEYAGGRWTMQPGEVRVLFSKSTPPLKRTSTNGPFKIGENTNIIATSQISNRGDIYIPAFYGAYQVVLGLYGVYESVYEAMKWNRPWTDDVIVRLSMKSMDVKNSNTIDAMLVYPKNPDGTMTKRWPTTYRNNTLDEDYSTDALVQRFNFKKIEFNETFERDFTVNEVFSMNYDRNRRPEDQPWVEPYWLASYDLWRISSDESSVSSPKLTNIRPYVASMFTYDNNISTEIKANGSNRSSVMFSGRGFAPGWAYKGTAATNGLETSLSIQHIQDGDKHLGYAGESSGAAGQTHVVLYEIPDKPITSLASLQHADISILDLDGSYTIGNSYRTIGLNTGDTSAKTNTTIFKWNENASGDGISRMRNRAQPRADHSFAANMCMFDSYFFSGVNFGKLPGQKEKMSEFLTEVVDNHNNIFATNRTKLNPYSSKSAEEIKKDFYNPDTVAKHILSDGAFNINSTSVEAWIAVLSGLNQQKLALDGEYQKLKNLFGSTTEAIIPFSRFMKNIGEKIGGFGAAKDGTGDFGKGWRGYPYATTAEIRALAINIVKEIRLRGPFMSLGEFVNRSLHKHTTTADIHYKVGVAGALQYAIDSLNTINNRIGMSAKNNDYWNWIPRLGQPLPNTNIAGSSTTNAGSGKVGAPGYLLQADILTSVGANFSARSDTFTIRAYGEAINATGTLAKSYCEAVVQRVPEFIEPDDDNDCVELLENYRESSNKRIPDRFERNENLSPTNKLLGRRYKIISFRWLKENEI